LIVLQFTSFKGTDVCNFFCDPSQLLNLSCSESFKNIIVMYFIGATFGFVPVSGVLYSYYKIISSFLIISSSSERYKAFSTCGSHLSVVCLFYGTGLGVYLGSAVSHRSSKGVVSSLMYNVVTPLMNPFIYSLRYRDISMTLKQLQHRTMLT
jgi:olfactory receptor